MYIVQKFIDPFFFPLKESVLGAFESHYLYILDPIALIDKSSKKEELNLFEQLFILNCLYQM